MQKSDRKKFIEIMAGMQESFTPDKAVKPEKVEIYWEMFKDWRLDAFRNACMHVVRTKTINTFPLVAEIINARHGGSVALMAWVQSRAAVGKYGCYQSVQFPDRVIHSVIEAMGGWIAFCDCPDKDRPWRQKEFERLYAVMQDKGKHPEYVVGIHEINNWGGGYKDRIEPFTVIPDDKQQLIENKDA